MSPTQPPRSRISSRRPRLLLVDDDPAILRGVLRVLRQCRPHFLVDTADSPSQALEAMGECRYDLVITDLDMPGGGGRAVLSALNALYPETGRVVHSSRLEASETLELCRSAHAVLAKPASEERILGAIEGALASVARGRKLSVCR